MLGVVPSTPRYKGMVSHVHKSSRGNTYDILYEDGDVEKQVKSSLVRALGSGAANLKRGDKVEANYAGKGTE